MTQPQDFDTLLLGRKGAPSVSFKSIGTVVEGVVVEKDSQHKRKYNPSPTAPAEYEFYKSGDPIMELVLTLKTEQNDPAIENDNGHRRVFLPFQMQQELAKAVRESGSRGLPLKSKLRITFTHETPSQGGGSPRKEYQVEFWPPADVAIQQTQLPPSGSVQVSGVGGGGGGGAHVVSSTVPTKPELGPELLAAIEALKASGQLQQ